MRRVLKIAAEGALASVPARRLGRIRRKRQRLVLAYHNVVPVGTAGGDRSLHLDFDRFRFQLDSLQSSLRVVGLDQALGPPVDGPVVALTFDDAYAGAVTLALPELAARSLPATVFVAPGLLDRGAPWWDRLARDGTVPEALRTRCLEQLGGETSRIDSEFGTPEPSPTARSLAIASQEELHAAAGLRGLTLASHTWSHPNLARLNGARLGEELAMPLTWLRGTFPEQARPWIAWPYGLSTALVHRAAQENGYSAGFAVSGGWSRPDDDPMVLPRLNVPSGLSRYGFLARVAGLLGI